ncbi:MAG: hypothetical protein IJK23_03070 [Clostridia bacterium]|nr:hypothetical protein [Clostridia bacterium]
MTDAEKLLAAVRGGKFSPCELADISEKLLRGLTPEQRALLQSLTADEKKKKEFLASDEVKNILGGKK